MRRLHLAVVVGSALGACAPLLDYDDLGRAPPDAGAATTTDAGVDGDRDDAAIDAGDLCRFAPMTAIGFYCGDVLYDGGSARDLWECTDKKRAPDSPYPCAFGCFQMPPNHADLCNRCDLGDGSYCAKEWRADYLSVDDVLITCQSGKATTKACPSECVHAAPASSCK